jgi:hypothetical protein
MKKVYCKDCKYYTYSLVGINEQGKNCYTYKLECCENPNNFDEVNTYLEVKKLHTNKPENKNKNNNCSWYEKKD